MCAKKSSLVQSMSHHITNKNAAVWLLGPYHLLASHKAIQVALLGAFIVTSRCNFWKQLHEWSMFYVCQKIFTGTVIDLLHHKRKRWSVIFRPLNLPPSCITQRNRGCVTNTGLIKYKQILPCVLDNFCPHCVWKSLTRPANVTINLDLNAFLTEKRSTEG